MVCNKPKAAQRNLMSHPPLPETQWLRERLPTLINDAVEQNMPLGELVSKLAILRIDYISRLTDNHASVFAPELQKALVEIQTPKRARQAIAERVLQASRELEAAQPR